MLIHSKNTGYRNTDQKDELIKSWQRRCPSYESITGSNETMQSAATLPKLSRTKDLHFKLL